MKNLKESLIKSYDTNKLINIIEKKYKDIRISLYPSKSNESLFYIEFNNKDDYNKFQIDQYIQKQLDFFGYYITEINNEQLVIFIEPNFGTKCTNFVYNECNGLVWHITSEEKYQLIKEQGIKPFIGNKKRYRYFTERIFLSCGENKDEIIDNIDFLIDQLSIKNPIILLIDLKDPKKYNIDFYYDPSEDNWHNYIYCNAWIPPKYISRINNIEDIKINIDESLNIINTPLIQSKSIFNKYISDNKYINNL